MCYLQKEHSRTRSIQHARLLAMIAQPRRLCALYVQSNHSRDASHLMRLRSSAPHCHYPRSPRGTPESPPSSTGHKVARADVGAGAVAGRAPDPFIVKAAARGGPGLASLGLNQGAETSPSSLTFVLGIDGVDIRVAAPKRRPPTLKRRRTQRHRHGC